MGLPPDSWEAYQLDVATLELGRFIESKLAERDGKGHPKHTLAGLLSVDDGAQVADKERFRSLAGEPMRRMVIPESGVWEPEGEENHLAVATQPGSHLEQGPPRGQQRY